MAKLRRRFTSATMSSASGLSPTSPSGTVGASPSAPTPTRQHNASQDPAVAQQHHASPASRTHTHTHGIVRALRVPSTALCTARSRALGGSRRRGSSSGGWGWRGRIRGWSGCRDGHRPTCPGVQTRRKGQGVGAVALRSHLRRCPHSSLRPPRCYCAHRCRGLCVRA